MPVTRVLPVVLLRVAGLPADVLDGLASPAVADELDRHRQCELAAEAVAGTVVTDLFALIPALESRHGERRAALRLRRDVFNGRHTAATERAAETLLPLLAPDGRRRLDTWLTHRRGAAQAVQDIDSLLRDTDSDVTARLLSTVRSGPLSASLAFASGAFTRELLTTESCRSRGRSARRIRTLLSYVTRAATKTSPFGALSTVTIAAMEGSGVSPVADVSAVHGDGPGRELVSPLPLAVHLLQSCAVHPEWGRKVRFRLNPSMRRVDDAWQAMLPEYVPAQGDLLPVRLDEVTAVGEAPAGPTVGSHPLAAWQGKGTPGERSRARRRSATGILLPETPWPRDSPTPLAELAARVAGPTAPERGLGRTLHELAGIERRIGDGDAAERARLDLSLRGHATDAFRELGAEVPHWLADAPLFHENIHASDVSAPLLPASLTEDLGLLGDLIGERTGRSALYEYLLADFTARYGQGGRCDDVLGFLYAFVRRPDYAKLVRRADELDASRQPEGDTALGPHGTVGAPVATVFHQLDAADLDALRHGDFRLIVNQIHPGAIGLLARWVAVPNVGEVLRAQLRSWLQTLYPDSRILPITAGGDYCAAQTLRKAIFPGLRWPSDLPAAGDVDGDDGDLRSLTLTHDPVSHTLQLRALDGASIAVPYLGVIPQRRLQGPLRLLSTLSNPWTTAIDDLRTQYGGRVGGRIRLGRPELRVRADEIPRPRPGETAAAHLVRLDAWRRGLGAARQCFARVDAADGGRPAGKPFWVDLASALGVRMFLRETDMPDAEVRLTEAAPDPRGSWLMDRAGRPRAVELASLVRLDRDRRTP